MRAQELVCKELVAAVAAARRCWTRKVMYWLWPVVLVAKPGRGMLLDKILVRYRRHMVVTVATCKAPTEAPRHAMVARLVAVAEGRLSRALVVDPAADMTQGSQATATTVATAVALQCRAW